MINTLDFWLTLVILILEITAISFGVKTRKYVVAEFKRLMEYFILVAMFFALSTMIHLLADFFELWYLHSFHNMLTLIAVIVLIIAIIKSKKVAE